jgi:hypothetical protein
MPPPSPDRRRLLVSSAIALLGGPTVFISACDSGSTAPTPPTPPPDRLGSISLNHGHLAIITAAQVLAGGALQLEIQGESTTHGHALDLTADEVTRIRRNEAVTVLSAAGWEDKHAHWVTFNA